MKNFQSKSTDFKLLMEVGNFQIDITVKEGTHGILASQNIKLSMFNIFKWRFSSKKFAEHVDAIAIIRRSPFDICIFTWIFENLVDSAENAKTKLPFHQLASFDILQRRN